MRVRASERKGLSKDNGMQGLARATLIIGVIVMASIIGTLIGGCGAGDAGEKDLVINCGQRVSGAERNIELSSDRIVACEHTLKHIEVDGDGMTGYEDIFSFTGIAPGDVCATVYDYLPWHVGYNQKGFVDRRVFLHVNDKLEISRYDAFEFEKIELVKTGTMAQSQYYIAEEYYGLVRMNAYEALPEEEPPTQGELKDCYVQLVMLLDTCDVKNWDGFSENNPHVLDGSSFDLSITRKDGSMIHARGTNATPEGFREFENAYRELF